MSVGWSTARRSGIDPGCGCGLAMRTGIAAEKALARNAALAGGGDRLRIARCPRRENVWHLVPVAEPAVPPEVRAAVLERDGYRCVCCGLSVRGQRYSLGHRLRAGQGGRAVPSNLLTFLGLGGELHHGRIDSRCDPHDEAKGYTVRSWQDPREIGVMYFSSPDGSGVTYWLDDESGKSAVPPGGVEVA